MVLNIVNDLKKLANYLDLKTTFNIMWMFAH